MARQSAKERKEQQEKEEQEAAKKLILFRETIAEKILYLLIRAKKLSVDFSITENHQNDIVIKLSHNRYDSIRDNEDYNHESFNLKEGDEFEFSNLERILSNVEEEIEQERIREEKLKAAQNKAKELLTKEERDLLRLNI